MLSTHSVPVLCFGDCLRNPDIPHAWPLLSSRRRAPSKCLGLRSTATTGVVGWVLWCLWDNHWGVGDRRGQGSQYFNYSGSLLVPRNGPLPASSPATFSTPSPTCLVQMSKTESLPKAKESSKLLSVHGLWPQLAHPLLLPWKSDFAAVFVVRLEYPHFCVFVFSIKANPTALSWRAFSQGRESSKKCQSSVWKYGDGVYGVVCPGVPPLSPSRGEPSLCPLSPSPTLAPPPAPSPVAPIGRFLPLTSRRHSRQCRPHTESSLPHGCPRQRREKMV